MNKLHRVERFAKDCSLFVKRSVGLWIALALFLVFLPSAHGQTSGQISGLVTDVNGGAIVGAKVSAINQASLNQFDTVTSNAGTFTFPVLEPGSYEIKVEQKGFQGADQKGYTLYAGGRVEVPTIVLQVGNVSVTMTVQATSQILQTDNAELGAVLSERDIDRLPLTTQNVMDLLKLLPGVTISENYLANGPREDSTVVYGQGGPVSQGYAMNGAAPNGGTSDLLDGANINDPGCNCNAIAQIFPDFVQEVAYQGSNFGADMAHGPTVVSSISKAGTSNYHGEGFFYAKNDVLNANDWVSNDNHTPKGSAHYYYPGGTIGGPIPFTHKKALFWFGYEKFLQNTGNATTVESWIPTSDMMSGNFTNTPANEAICANAHTPGISAANTGNYCNDLTGTMLPDGTTIGGTSVSNITHLPVTLPAGTIPSQFLSTPSALDAQIMAKIWPTPNATPSAGNNYADYFKTLPGVIDGYVWRSRVDYNFSDNTKLFISYQYSTVTSVEQNGGHIYWTPTGSFPFPGGGMTGLDQTKVLAGHFIHTFNATLTNDLAANITKANNPVSVPDVSAVYKSTLGGGYVGSTVFNTGDKWIPSYGGGYQQTPDFSQQDIFNNSGQYTLLKEQPSVFDDLVKVWGTHTIKVGAFYEMLDNNQGGFDDPNGTYYFSGGPALNAVTNVMIGSPNSPTANFLLGNGTSYSENNSNPGQDLAVRNTALYFNDDWKATRRLTVEYGVRFDHMGRWYDRGPSGVAVFLPQKVSSDFYSGNTSTPGLSWHGINPGIPKGGMPDPLVNVSPRFGLSYDVFGTGKTVVRGGWGSYHFTDNYGDFSGAVSEAQGALSYSLPSGISVLLNQMGSGQVNVVTGDHNLSPSSTAGSAPACCAGSVTAVNPNDRNIPTTYAYNLTVDEQLPWKSMLEVAYVGNQVKYLLIGGGNGATLTNGPFTNVNKMPLGALFSADPVTGVVSPNPENIGGPGSVLNKAADYDPYGYAYGSNTVEVANHGGYSNYNALQVAWQKRSERLTFNLNYTRSKILGTTLAINPFVLHGNYGPTNYDRPNVINTSYSYDDKNLYHGGNSIIAGAVNNWLISGDTTWQGGGNLQALDSPNFGMSLQYTTINGVPIGVGNELPAGVTPGYGASTYYGTNAGMLVMPVTTCNPGSHLKENQHVNASCFAPPAIGSYGPRVYPYLAGPSYTDSDLAIGKTFHLVKNNTVSFRAAAQDWLNHPPAAFSSNQLSLYYDADYATKATTLAPQTSSTFGTTDTKTGGDNRRIIQLDVKYNF